MTSSVVFKCTFNDGGQGRFYGFSGRCSVGNIASNIKNKRVWCSDQKCSCKQSFDNGFKTRMKQYPCQESQLFQSWEIGAGTYHNGEKKGDDITIKDAGIGKICILTTREPEQAESERKVFGFFEIKDIIGNRLIANKLQCIKLPIDEARMLNYWDYASIKQKTPAWGTGLFRYIDDDAVHRLLHDVSQTVQNTGIRDKILKLIQRQKFQNSLQPAKGLLSRQTTREDKVAKQRKYGSGGEGADHKNLKEWVAKYPEKIGLPKDSVSKVEYPFLSGDRADIVFNCPNNAYAAVEIETTITLPGAYQAIKYRSLLTADKDLPRGHPKVVAILVAWNFDEETVSFCEKNDIRYFELKV